MSIGIVRVPDFHKSVPVRYTSMARFVLEFYASPSSPRHSSYANFQATVKEAEPCNQVNLVSAY